MSAFCESHTAKLYAVWDDTAVTKIWVCKRQQAEENSIPYLRGNSFEDYDLLFPSNVECDVSTNNVKCSVINLTHIYFLYNFNIRLDQKTNALTQKYANIFFRQTITRLLIMVKYDIKT